MVFLRPVNHHGYIRVKKERTKRERTINSQRDFFSLSRTFPDGCLGSEKLAATHPYYSSKAKAQLLSLSK